MIDPVRLPSPHCQGLKLQPKMSHSAQAEKFLDVLGRRIEQAASKVRGDAKFTAEEIESKFLLDSNKPDYVFSASYSIGVEPPKIGIDPPSGCRNYKLDPRLLQAIGPPAIRSMLRESGLLSALRSYSVEVGNDLQLDDHSVKLTILVKSRS